MSVLCTTKLKDKWMLKEDIIGWRAERLKVRMGKEEEQEGGIRGGKKVLWYGDTL